MARLIEELRKLPGIGAKSAQRLAFHILRASTEDAGALADAVRELKAKLLLCSTCNNITDVDPCTYCFQRDPQPAGGVRGGGAGEHRGD
jgi:recombination protein RecR